MVKKPFFSTREIEWCRYQREVFKIPYRKVAAAFTLFFDKHISYRTIHKWETEWGWITTLGKYKAEWKKYMEATMPSAPLVDITADPKAWEEYYKAMDEWRKTYQ